MTSVHCFGVALFCKLVASAFAVPRRLVRSSVDVATLVSSPSKVASDLASVTNASVDKADTFERAANSSEVCTDNPQPWMIENNQTCATWTFMYTNRCNAAVGLNPSRESWVKNKWCQKSCWDNGNGYDGDNCGPKAPVAKEWSPLSPQPFQAQSGGLWETKVESDCEREAFQNKSECPNDCLWEEDACIKQVFVLQWSDHCEHPIDDSEICFRARQLFQPGAILTNTEQAGDTLPGGCSIFTDSWKTNFNSNTNSSAPCSHLSTCVCEKGSGHQQHRAHVEEDENQPAEENDWEKRLSKIKDNASANVTGEDLGNIEMSHYTKVVFSLFALFLILGVAVRFKKNNEPHPEEVKIKDDDFDDTVPVFAEMVDEDGHAVK